MNGKSTPGVDHAVDKNHAGTLRLPTTVVIIRLQNCRLRQAGVDGEGQHALRLVAFDVVVVRRSCEDALRIRVARLIKRKFCARLIKPRPVPSALDRCVD